MKVTALAPWFGGKRTLAPKVIELLGEHRTYVEPFCGSMAVLLHHRHSFKHGGPTHDVATPARSARIHHQEQDTPPIVARRGRGF